jgi:histidyl-tRNA synthetase
MVAERANALRKPVRWFSIPQLFRYERAQRGRLREHYQLNVDIVGEPGELADAELLAVSISIMQELGLGSRDVRARVSDRRLLNAILSEIGVGEPARQAAVYAVLDKFARQPRELSVEKLTTAGLGGEMLATALQLPEVRHPGDLPRQLAQAAGVEPHVRRMNAYLGHLDALGVREWVDIDLSIVRGLDYYTGIVFELFDAKGELRAICGGGRYDTLLADLGGVDLPALGFGMGDVVLGELLRERGLMPASAGTGADLYFVGGNGVLEHPIGDALRLVHLLRDAGLSVDYALSAERYQAQPTRNQVDSARKSGARAAICFASGTEVLVQGLTGKLKEAPNGTFAAGPLLAGDGPAIAAFRSWFADTISPRNAD